MNKPYIIPQGIIEADLYISNRAFEARSFLTMGNPDGAERRRAKLVQDLKQVKPTDLIGRCIKLVNAADWRTEQGVEILKEDMKSFLKLKQSRSIGWK